MVKQPASEAEARVRARRCG